MARLALTAAVMIAWMVIKKNLRHRETEQEAKFRRWRQIEDHYGGWVD